MEEKNKTLKEPGTAKQVVGLALTVVVLVAAYFGVNIDTSFLNETEAPVADETTATVPDNPETEADAPKADAEQDAPTVEQKPEPVPTVDVTEKPEADEPEPETEPVEETEPAAETETPEPETEPEIEIEPEPEEEPEIIEEIEEEE